MSVLGVDIGGSSIKAGAVDLARGEVIGDVVEVPTPQPAPPGELANAVREAVVALSDTDVSSAVDEMEGKIGCTFPGRIRAGMSLTAVNLHESWVGERPADHFEAATRRQFHVINDADAAGLAELAFGAGAGRGGVILVVTLGTGIGTALFVDGTLLPNTELGHLNLSGRPANDLISRSAREKGMSWEEWAQHVSAFLERMQDLIDPDLVIIGGGVSDRPDVLEPALHQTIEVVPAALGNTAGIVGAALAASHA